MIRVLADVFLFSWVSAIKSSGFCFLFIAVPVVAAVKVICHVRVLNSLCDC